MIVREILHAHIPLLTQDSTVRDAVDKMDIYQFPALVVVDETQKPLGVLTEGDICRYIQKGNSLEDLGKTKAHHLATKPATLIPPSLELEAAFWLMLSNNLTLLPVVEDNRLSGIVLRVDLMQALLMEHATREQTV